jgi:hypothetical protein
MYVGTYLGFRVARLGDFLLFYFKMILSMYISQILGYVNPHYRGKNGLGYVLVHFFTNSFGHPGMLASL